MHTNLTDLHKDARHGKVSHSSGCAVSARLVIRVDVGGIDELVLGCS